MRFHCTKISNFGSVFGSLFSRHILWDNVEAPNFLFSQYTRLEWMSFWLAIVVISNPSNFVNAHFTWVCCWCKEYTMIKLIGLLLTTMASQSNIFYYYRATLYKSCNIIADHNSIKGGLKVIVVHCSKCQLLVPKLVCLSFILANIFSLGNRYSLLNFFPLANLLLVRAFMVSQWRQIQELSIAFTAGVHLFPCV